jgi:hypothetical protein
VKAATIIGVILILLGIGGFLMGRFSFTHEKRDVNIGPLRVEHRQKKSVPIPPVLSVIALVGGMGLVVVGARSK